MNLTANRGEHTVGNAHCLRHSWCMTRGEVVEIYGPQVKTETGLKRLCRLQQSWYRVVRLGNPAFGEHRPGGRIVGSSLKHGARSAHRTTQDSSRHHGTRAGAPGGRRIKQDPGYGGRGLPRRPVKSGSIVGGPSCLVSGKIRLQVNFTGTALTFTGEVHRIPAAPRGINNAGAAYRAGDFQCGLRCRRFRRRTSASVLAAAFLESPACNRT